MNKEKERDTITYDEEYAESFLKRLGLEYPNKAFALYGIDYHPTDLLTYLKDESVSPESFDFAIFNRYKAKVYMVDGNIQEHGVYTG